MVVALSMFNKNLKNFFLILISTGFLFSCDIKEEVGHTSSALMVPVTYQQWSEQLTQYTPKIVVVDMWAMWCVSCIERFPEMVKLHEKYQNRNVQFVSINLDDREDAQSLETAEKFLTKMDAKFDHFRMDENLLEAFEKLNLISIPAVIVYDRKSEERYRLTGDNPNKQFSEKDIESAIIELLQQY